MTLARQIFGWTPETPERGLPGFVAAHESPAGGVTLTVRAHGAAEPPMAACHLPPDQATALADALLERNLAGLDRIDPILQFFAYDHLPAHLQAVSRPFGLLARRLVVDAPRNPERAVALRKLLEARDAAVRAVLHRDD
jgi:hypothetical protein